MKTNRALCTIVMTTACATLATPPFTAEQIRDATPAGRTYVWRIEAGGKPAVERQLVFTEVDAVGATTVATMLADGRPVGEPSESQTAWVEFVGHATYAKDLPGAPVKHVITKDGEVVSSMVLIAHKRPEI